jgi:hypothetical protein
MKLNKWTVALAAVGAVSLASAAKAEEKASPVLTALSTTTLSGYVDTSAEWNFGTGNTFMPPYKFGGTSKADGFNLDVVQIRIEKPLDETEWAAGYRVDLWAGPDANTLGTQSTLSSGSSDFAIRQAYVNLRTPIGNGLEWKMGVFDSIIGYESVEAPLDPNFTRSYGHSIEPQTETGLLASYRFCPEFSASVGVANTMNSAINSRAQAGSTGMVGGIFGSFFPSGPSPLAAPGDNAKAESYKSYMGSVAITAPDSMGFLAGSTLYGGVVSGFDNSVVGTGVGLPHYNAYVGATIATPVKALKLGVAFDELDVASTFNTSNPGSTIPNGTRINASIWTVAGYASYQLTEKMSLHGRCEYADARIDEPVSADAQILATTVTLQYDLWKNVLSRLEFRWDHSLNDQNIFGGTGTLADTSGPDRDNAYMLALNVIYKF